MAWTPGDDGTRVDPRRSHQKGGTVMAYVPCHSCGIYHKNIPQADVILVLNRFQEGTGQIVTPAGIEPRCILEILELPVTQRKARMNAGGKLVGTGSSAYQR